MQLLHREPGLETNEYHGTRTAVIVLPDLRVGDVIFFEYSLVGSNPVLGGHVMQSLRLGASTGIALLRNRVISDRPLELRAFVDAPAPEVRQQGVITEYTWVLRDVLPTPSEEAVPLDHDVVPWVQLTDFQSWHEVNEWGRKLFRVPEVPSKRVLDLAAEIREQWPSPTDQVRAVLRRVQDDVRYLSLAFAESTHRPTDPAVVLERRFGDCKDKSLLAVSLFRELGLAAEVALVSTSMGRRLDEMMPSIRSFDHVIVRVEVDGNHHWLDATRMYQRGGLADSAARGFHQALVLAPGENGLTEIPEPEDLRPNIGAKLQYTVVEWGGALWLDADVTYTGYVAELLRGAHASTSRENFNAMAGEPILKAHPQAVPVGDAVFVDHEQYNEVVVHQRFDLARSWVTAKDGRVVFRVVPAWLVGRMPVPAADRVHPFALDHPVHVVHDVVMHLPQIVPNTELPRVVDTASFAYVYRPSTNENVVTLHTEYRSRAPAVTADGFAEYRRAYGQLSEVFEYFVWYRLPSPPNAVGWPTPRLLGIALGWTAMMLALVVVTHLRRPYWRRKRVAWEPELAGRRGWLALLGLAVTFGPVRTLIDFWPALPAYESSAWTSVTTPGGEHYQSGLSFLLLMELLLNITVVVGGVYAAVLYWSKHRSFPLVFVSCMAFSFFAVLLDQVLVAGNRALEHELTPAEVANLTVSVPVTFAWVLYVLNSKRVKATFLPRPKSRRRKKKPPRPPESTQPVSPDDSFAPGL